MWRSVEPTTSMSTARKQRCTEVRRWRGGVSWPRKNGLNGCMPAVVSSTDWSSAEGTSEAEGTARCPRSTKKSVKRAADLVGCLHGGHRGWIVRGRRPRRLPGGSALPDPPLMPARRVPMNTGCEASRRSRATRARSPTSGPTALRRACGHVAGDPVVPAPRLPLLPRLRARSRRLLHAPLHARGRPPRIRDAGRGHRRRDRRGHARALHDDRGGRRTSSRAAPAACGLSCSRSRTPRSRGASSTAR